MKRYDVVLFDLDGTLTDPGEGITNSVAYALKKFGIEVPERRELYGFIGPPLSESFARYFGLKGDQITQAIAWYREYYRPYGVHENLLYDGVEEMLKCLHDSGKTILLATSKPEMFARQILEHFELDRYFHYIAGATLDGTRDHKADVIRYALECANVTPGEHIIMVGDRSYDVIGARLCGLDAVGVLSGYGNRRELEEAGARYIVEHIRDVGLLLE